MSDLFIGLMSGTSLDGVDGVLVDFSGARPVVLTHSNLAFSPALKAELLSLNEAGNNELHRAALAANALVRRYAEVVTELLNKAELPASAVKAIGAHGQTVRHRPQAFDGTGYTLQLNNPSLLAELTGIDVVADFRSRDLAAGGQGAPLVVAFHQTLFAKPGQTLSVLNIGGISNLSVLGDQAAAIGFDCGPGNALLDFWCHQHTGMAFDEGGAWAASGQVMAPLLAALLDEAFFKQAPPKSTGRDLFNPAWLAAKLNSFSSARAADVQATLSELTAAVCANSLIEHGRNSRELIVCGGGSLNTHLMRRLQARLPQLQVRSSQDHGLPPLQVEATAFAWLAHKAMQRQTGSLPSVTGASGARVLGGVYAA
jgi:anhydro-N-acetylmuramic acid kinase